MHVAAQTTLILALFWTEMLLKDQCKGAMMENSHYLALLGKTQLCSLFSSCLFLTHIFTNLQLKVGCYRWKKVAFDQAIFVQKCKLSQFSIQKN